MNVMNESGEQQAEPQEVGAEPTPAARRRAAEFRRRTARAFDTRTEAWQEAGLISEIDRAEARKALGEAIVLVILLAGVLVVFANRADLFPGAGKPVRYVTAALLVLIGWGLARTVAKAAAPALMKRMDPATAGTVGFLFRLFTIAFVIFASLAIAGVKPETLAVGGAFTAVVLGLAAQQTLGNVIAGATLLSARPFRVGDRVRVQGSGISVEGTVATLGLFHTTLVNGADRILIPNSVLMSVAVMPLNEPEPVEVTARFDSSQVTPSSLQAELEERITVALIRAPEVELEEIGADAISTFTILATPESSRDGAQLAADVLAAIGAIGGEGDTDPRGEPATQTKAEL
ncbi:MAG: mechanosensitive ion channel family protein [Solirubrobacterales bacterium]